MVPSREPEAQRDMASTIDLEWHCDPVWKVVAGVKGLKQLHLVFRFSGYPIHEMQYQDLLFEPMRKLRGLKECKVGAGKQSRTGVDDYEIIELSASGRRVVGQAVLP